MITSSAKIREVRKGNTASPVEVRIQEELKKLIEETGLGSELRVKWLPGGSDKLEGEVKGNVIYIYVFEPEKAIDTLLHEFLDYIISKAIKPYQKVSELYRAAFNALIGQIGEEAYREKEKVVEALKKVYEQKRGLIEG